jgi:uncharacterized protein (DUF302 family)
MTSGSYGRSAQLAMPFADAVSAVRDALADQGFGVLTEIDVTGTLREKIGAQIEDYVILGACNPQLASKALDADRSVGLLLPCNVVVRAAGDGSVVEVLDPQVMADVADEPRVREVADEAGRRLDTALAALAARSG